MNKETRYHEQISWLFSQVAVYQNQGRAAYKPGLEKMLAFAQHLGDPHNTLPVIHIGGTNGKGSTAHLMAAALQNKGAKVGLYTSPHLLDFTERIRINGQSVTKAFVSTFIDEHRAYILARQLSFFEVTFGMALAYFALEVVDYAIIEVGLGGRLDATNIVRPLLSVITNIGLDHTEFLGDTHALIAAEKAGIIKEGVPVVIGEKNTDTAQVFIDKAKEKAAPLVFASDEPEWGLSTDLKGDYQGRNVQTAAVALRLLLPELTHEDLGQSFQSVIALTNLRGRWETLQQSPTIVADVTHNKEGFFEVVRQLKKIKSKSLHMVLGFVKGKPLEEILSLLPSQGKYYFCAPAIARAEAVANVVAVAERLQLSYTTYSSVDSALEAAKNNADPKDFIYVGGSTFVVAEVLS